MKKISDKLTKISVVWLLLKTERSAIIDVGSELSWKILEENSSRYLRVHVKSLLLE